MLTEPRRLPKHSQYQSLPPIPKQQDSVDDLPLPPTPKNAMDNPYRYESLGDMHNQRKARTSTNSLSSSSSSKRSQSQPPHSLANGQSIVAAPSIDREKKPSRIPKDSGFHTYNHSARQKPSKMTIYDAYATNTASTATITSGHYTTGRYRNNYDPYKIYTNGNTDHTIKNGIKPVPPPKPKAYPTARSNGSASSHVASTSFVEGNYMNSCGPGESDSGQGSSLDQRDYGIYNNEPRYANPPGPYSMDGMNGHQRPNGGHYKQNGSTPNGSAHHQNGLDLTNNREYRGSAFELYKKPLSFYSTQPGASVASPPNPPPPNSRYTNSVW